MDEARIQRLYWLVAGISVVAVVLVYLARHAIAPFAVAYALAYLFDPLVDRIESKKFSRTFGIVLLLILLFGLLLVGSLILIPLLQLQVMQLVESLPNYIGTVQKLIKPLLDQVSGLDAGRIQLLMHEGLQRFGKLPLDILSSTSRVLWKSFSGLLNVLQVVIQLVLIPVAMFYLLRDFDEINAKVMNLVPGRFRDKTTEIVQEIDQVISKFVRGQLTVATVMAALYSLGLYVSGTPLSLVIGVAAGYANLVPYLGLAVGFVPAIVLTALQHQEILPIVGVLITFGVVQTLEGMVITPRLLGGEIGLHPVIIMLAILVGAEFFGILGVILAVPVTAVLNVLVKRSVAAYRTSPLYE